MIGVCLLRNERDRHIRRYAELLEARKNWHLFERLLKKTD